MTESSDMTRPDGAVRVSSAASWWGDQPAGDPEPFVMPTVWGGGSALAGGTSTPSRVPAGAGGGLGVEVQRRTPSGTGGEPGQVPGAEPGKEPEGIEQRLRDQVDRLIRWWSGPPIHEAPSPGPRWLGALLLAWQGQTSTETGAGTGTDTAGGAR